jgi:N-formylglutamate amidohydrolase
MEPIDPAGDSPATGQGRDAPGKTGRSPAGGQIPGLSRAPAFVLSAPEPSELPVLIAVPHAGRAYPPALLEKMRNPTYAALRLEDRYVDRLGQAVAAATGAALLVAHAPRAMVDLNRAADDVDWEMIARGATPAGEDGIGVAVEPGRGSGRRALSGLGLIPRRLPGIGELWKRRHERAELDSLIRDIHEPYHAALGEALGALHARWGAALLLDLHSMPPLSLRGAPAPEFVVGDRFGATCAGPVTAAAFACFAENRRLAAHNRPYAGGYVLERHAAPRRGVHAIQLEIDRSSYLDSRLAEPGPGFAGMVELLTALVRRLAGEVAALAHERRPGGWPGKGWAEAAE